MDSSLLHQYLTVASEPSSAANPMPLRPQKSITKTYAAVPQRDSTEIELARMSRSGYALRDETPTASGQVSPDLEMSRPASPSRVQEDGVEALQSLWDPRINRFRLLSACSLNLMNGMSDAASGPLIPYMEKHYNIGYAVVSLLFVGQAIGFITGAPLIDPLRARLGVGRAIALSQLCMAAGYITIACTAPFPAIVVAFAAIGLGMSVNLALNNIFCGSLKQSTAALGAVHGSYGIGGIAAPLIATAFVSVLDLVWSRFYLIPLGWAVFNAVLALCVYRNAELTSAPAPLTTAAGSSRLRSASRLHTAIQTLKSPIVVLGALFIFAYQGAEVSISGWVISFLSESRADASPDRVGYVTSGFWGGITLGRFLLSLPAHKIGEKRFVYGAVVGAAGFELVVWLVPNVVGDAVAVAVVGLLLGPVYPCAAAVFMRTMSRGEKLSGMGVISAFGSSGGAAAPFLTGLLSQVAGTFVLHPIAIGLFAAMLVCWYGLPAQRKRRE